MNYKKYDKVLPFIIDYIILLTLFVFMWIFIIWTKFQFISLDFFVLIASIYFVKIFKKLFNIINDVKENNIIEEYLYIQFIGKRKFDSISFKEYIHVQCHKVKGKRFTNEKVFLKVSKDLGFKEKWIVKIEYYRNSKIIYDVCLESKTK